MKTLISLFIFIVSLQAHAEIEIMIEGGAVWQHRNDVAIPPGIGTYTEFDKFNQGPFPHVRTEIQYLWGKSHGLRLLLAPFNVTVKGTPTSSIIFNGSTFNPGQELTVDYRFNSYRFGYFYAFWGHGDDQLNLGFTGKIRDARIRISQSGVSRDYDNLGFVPLIYFEWQKALSKSWLFNLQMDAAGASQGRAIDAALKLRNKVSDDSSWAFGIRSLEGGADNDEVFTFSWFNYLVVDYSLSF